MVGKLKNSSEEAKAKSDTNNDDHDRYVEKKTLGTLSATKDYIAKSLALKTDSEEDRLYDLELVGVNKKHAKEFDGRTFDIELRELDQPAVGTIGRKLGSENLSLSLETRLSGDHVLRVLSDLAR